MNYNPAAHVLEHTYNNGDVLCGCGWYGVNFNLHIIAMQVSHEVFEALKPHVIEEEP